MEHGAKKQTPGSAAQGRLRFGLGVRWSAQTAVADVAGGDGIAGRLLECEGEQK